ncbi:uncharacterized protein N7483_001006 [Penicillium malachiteum]|uniref:uncharacterized protein n=1 Tax=Penicillium malachiteum TaxID=1324776 RepID=UPI002547B0AC|nr:uncharacterized protein N7483_001006 [Penicillium malachiteum]KAJ5735881.1 hypothetical protein N7483_001006 [Penicillium malachiteum]
MRGAKPPPYEAVPAEEQDSVAAQATVEHSLVKNNEHDKPPPQSLNHSWLERLLRLAFDLIIAVIALLFAAFGIMVLQADGDPAGPGTMGAKLFTVSQYTPTVFPVLFAAIAGSSMKSIAAWRVQTSQGATIGFIQQCLGSQTISSAFLVQIRLRALNVFAVCTLILWCLSPLGSQASLRVISIVPNYPSTSINLTTANTFTEYQYGLIDGAEMAMTTITNPVIASIMSTTLLRSRNQDLWGNIRFPVIKNLSNSSSDWMDMPANSELTYASLVGSPVADLSTSGNTSFTLPGSYLSISCPDFSLVNQTGFTNFTNSSAPAPGNNADCSWIVSEGGTQYQIAISDPCPGFNTTIGTGTRYARKFVWESADGYFINNGINPDLYTQATCDLTTTFVDVNVTCTGSSSSNSAGSTCTLSSVRRSPTPPADGNWTVLDLGGDSYSYREDANAVLTVITELFPDAQLGGGQQPIISYLIDPISAVGNYQGTSVYSVGRSVFETRIGQIFNAALYLGISPSAFTGSYNDSSDLPSGGRLSLNATVTTQHDVVRCSRGWLGVLIIASFGIFVFALMGAILRIMTLSPDVLGSVSAIFLNNRITGITGASTWSSDEWTRHLKDEKLYLGDVEPTAEVGCIALATSSDDVPVGQIKKGRDYT